MSPPLTPLFSYTLLFRACSGVSRYLAHSEYTQPNVKRGGGPAFSAPIFFRAQCSINYRL